MTSRVFHARPRSTDERSSAPLTCESRWSVLCPAAIRPPGLLTFPSPSPNVGGVTSELPKVVGQFVRERGVLRAFGRVGATLRCAERLVQVDGVIDQRHEFVSREP